MNTPLISVIMPVYNGGKYLAKAIDSILYQSYSRFEFIIINDGSTDNTLDIISSYDDSRIKLINQSKKGLIASLNSGINFSNGEWIGRMDSDDISYSNRLEEQLRYISDDISVIGTQAFLIDEYDRIFGVTNYERSHDKILSRLLAKKSSMNHPSVLINKKKIMIVGGYDPKMKDAEDTELWLRLSKVGKLLNIQYPLIGLRKHESNISKLQLETASLNGYIGLAYHVNSNSYSIMSEYDYGIIHRAINSDVGNLVPRLKRWQNTKEKIKLLSKFSKNLFLLNNLDELLNYIIIKIINYFILTKIKRVSS